MRATDDHAYTTELVAVIMKHWAQIVTARDAGTMSINVSSSGLTGEENIAANQLMSMLPRPMRAANTNYQIDSLAAIYCDVQQAINKSLNNQQKVRLLMHHYDGYSMEEIADFLGVSRQAIFNSLNRYYRIIAEYLESVKPVKPERPYRFAPYTHTRSYFNPTYIPPQRPETAA